MYSFTFVASGIIFLSTFLKVWVNKIGFLLMNLFGVNIIDLIIISRLHVNNYWTEDNLKAYFPRYAGYNQSLGYGKTVTDRYLQNVSYIRLKSLQIGYDCLKIGFLVLRCKMPYLFNGRKFMELVSIL